MTNRMLTRRQLSTSALIATGLALTGPNLRSSALGFGDGDTAIEAATTFSDYEVTGNIWPLYQRLHSDAREIVPYYAVEYWYANDFTPRGPDLIEATGVEFVDWTWEVTGTTYPGTAEVAYSQAFADGSTVEDVVRLVQEDGEWRWFFGRNRAFVDQQVRLGGEALFPNDSTDAPDWLATLADQDGEAIDRLPEEYPGEEDGTLEDVALRGQGVERTYRQREGYTVARVRFDVLLDGDTPLGEVQSRIDTNAHSPGFAVLAWDIRDDVAIQYAICKRSTGPVNQDFIEAVVASAGAGSVWTISAPDEAAIEALANELIG